MEHQAPDGFAQQLGRFARRIRLRQLSRGWVGGASIGALVSALLSGAFWALRLGTWRPLSLVAIAVGGICGLLLSLRRRFSTVEVALFLDARLGTGETLTTAISVDTSSPPTAFVRSLAESALSAADPSRARLRVFSRWHALAVPAFALAFWLCRLPIPATPSTPPGARGSEIVKLKDVPGLDRIEALSSSPALSNADAEQLKRLAEAARQLRADLGRGMQKREAQARLAKLRDDVAAQRERFGDQSERPGLEAALAELEARPELRRAAKALGDGDLVAFDSEMQRLANQAESHARDAAKKALESGARAAQERGGQAHTQRLERQRKLFDEREAKMQALRELARSLRGRLGEEAQRDLADLDRTGDPEAARRLADALADALDGLSDNERKALGEALKRKLDQAPGEANAMSREELNALAERLKSEKGRRELREGLQNLAKQGSTDANRERALEEAERGGAEAQRGLSTVPVPLPGNESRSASPRPNSPSTSSSGEPMSGGPSSPGGSKGTHEGSSEPVSAEELRARAHAQLLPGAPLATRSLGRTQGRAGEVANQVGTGSLSSRAAAEVSAVEGADIPEEYREHVGRYFEP
jgi:hypothetical protein